MNKINAIIKTLTAQISIIIIILTVFYYRFLKERAIGPIDTQLNGAKFIVYILLISFYVYSIYRMLYPPKKITYLVKLMAKINVWYMSSLQELYNILQDTLGPQYVKKIDILLTLWVNIPLILHKILIYIIKIGIPLVIALAFLVEILIKKGIYHFPKFLWLLLLYFLLDFIWYMFIYYTQSFIALCETSILKVRLDENNRIISIDMPDKTNLDEQIYLLVQSQYVHFVHEYVVFKDEILPFLLQYKNFLNIQGKKHLQILRQLIWLTSWTTLLLYMVL